MEISYFIAHYDFEANIQKIINVYRGRRNAMVEALAEMLPTGVTCTQPQGGLFLWLELPKQLKAVELLKECLLHDVAFVPGDSFFPNGGVTNTLRLNYSNMPEDKIREGVKRLSYAIRKSMG